MRLTDPTPLPAPDYLYPSPRLSAAFFQGTRQPGGSQGPLSASKAKQHLAGLAWVRKHYIAYGLGGADKLDANAAASAFSFNNALGMREWIKAMEARKAQLLLTLPLLQASSPSRLALPLLQAALLFHLPNHS